MKTLGIVWKVIVNIITLAIVLGIFSIASTQFETIVLSVLILIYLSIWVFATSWGMYQLKFSETLDSEFKNIKRLLDKDTGYSNLKDLFTGEDILNSNFPRENFLDEGEKEAIKEKKEIMKYTKIKFYIYTGFYSIIYIIALYHILIALSIF